MTEHMFSHGPNAHPAAAELQVLERVAKRHGLRVVSYPTLRHGDTAWAFHGRNNGRFVDQDIEDLVRAELDADPVFRGWQERGGERS